MATITITTDYNATTANDVILVDATSNNVSVFLPSSPPLGKRITIKDKEGFATTRIISVIPNGADTVDTISAFTFTTKYQSVNVHSDGATNWSVL